mmetsp:Transcript_107052/g.149287  ORF Transcript_107052/g.149287 Transcript_107052/m.149287 type:complete len:104 (+) Transcript_107052:77-388(+)
MAMKRPADAEPAEENGEAPPAKKFADEASTAASTPEMGPSTSPEARDHAHHSDLWQLPIKELKARLESQGSSITGVTEKTELILMLEQLSPAPATQSVPPFEL